MNKLYMQINGKNKEGLERMGNRPFYSCVFSDLVSDWK